MKRKYPTYENILFLLRYCFENDWVSSNQIAMFLETTKRSAIRIMMMLYDIQGEIGFLKVEKIDDEGYPYKFKVRINSKWVNDED